MEQQLIKKITGGLFGMKMGTKEPREVAVLLNKLKPLNPMMHEELFDKYKNLVVKTNQASNVSERIFSQPIKTHNYESY